MLVVALVLMVALSAVYIAGRERNKKKVLAFKALATLVADFLALGFARQSGRALAWWFVAGIFFYSSSSGGSGGTGSASGASGTGSSGGAGRAVGASGTLHGRCLQRPLHFG